MTHTSVVVSTIDRVISFYWDLLSSALVLASSAFIISTGWCCGSNHQSPCIVLIFLTTLYTLKQKKNYPTEFKKSKREKKFAPTNYILVHLLNLFSFWRRGTMDPLMVLEWCCFSSGSCRKQWSKPHVWLVCKHLIESNLRISE